MDFTNYTAIKNHFTETPNLCDLFKVLSIETWKRIEHTYIKPRVKISETTITQNLIFSINAYKDQYGLNIEVFEALNEKANGNDFELIIKFPEDGIEFYSPVQAKKVYRNGKYTSMDYGEQIESLISYANDHNAKPLYLLYNFAASPIKSGITLGVPSELIGCSLISAEYLFNNHYKQRTKRDGSKGWLIPHFYDLNPEYAFPWHELVCPSNATDLYNNLQIKSLLPQLPVENTQDLINKNNRLKLGFYPIDTYTADGWTDINTLAVSKIDFEKEYKDSEPLYQAAIRREYSEMETTNKKAPLKEDIDRISVDFTPKSRIVLTK